MYAGAGGIGGMKGGKNGGRGGGELRQSNASATKAQIRDLIFRLVVGVGWTDGQREGIGK